jgi:hypothetical protein
MDHKGIRQWSVDWIHLAQDRDRRRALVTRKTVSGLLGCPTYLLTHEETSQKFFTLLACNRSYVSLGISLSSCVVHVCTFVIVIIVPVEWR